MSGTRPRGRPVSEKLAHDLIEAAIALLEEKGSFDAVSIEALCARAGVSKASFYRRWPDRDHFIVMLLQGLRQLPPPGDPVASLRGDPIASLRADLIAILDSIFGDDPRRTRIVHAALVSEGRKNRPLMEMMFRHVIAPRRKALLDRLRAGLAQGELRADTDITALYEILSAPVLKLVMLSNFDQPIPHRFAERIVDQALRGAAPEKG